MAWTSHPGPRTSAPPLPVPLNDLRRMDAQLRAQIDDAVNRVVSSGWFVLGPENEALEAELASYLGAGHAISVANGTDALQLALTALGVGAGDTVLTAANAGGYTSTAARAIGATPVYADVCADNLLLSVATLEDAVDRLPRPPAAVVVTHLYGRAADMTSIMDWATAKGLLVVEDCAQSMGVLHAGRRGGTFGHAATTSFYPTKNLGALGDGGAVFTADPTVAERVRRLRQYGWEAKYHAGLPGGRNSRMDELQAAIVRVKLPHLDAWNERRRAIHRRYEEAATPSVRLVNTASPEFVGHLAVLEADDRDKVAELLGAAGVRTDVHYPVPDHRQRIMSDMEQPRLAVTERTAGSILSIPLFPELDEAEVDQVAAALRTLPA